MKVVPIHGGGHASYLDVCTACHFLWFDRNELESVPKADARKLTDADLSPEAKTSLAKVDVALAREERKSEIIDVSGPDNAWEYIPAILGLPVEHDSRGTISRPVVTWALSALMIAVALLTFRNLDTVIESWGLIPAHPGRHFGMTFITSFFLHGGLLHLLGNLYFFLVFGDNVEDVMGRLPYALLIALAALAGDIVHVLGDPRSSIPSIGASGGISGVFLYSALQFPKSRVGLLIFFRWVRIPAALMIILWVIGQVYGALMQISGYSNVSALAHLGGAGVGLLFWLYDKYS